MAHSIQKRVKFSKGQIAPELVERTDLDIYDSSAQEMTNVTSTIYGGVRSRRGTKYWAQIYSAIGISGTVTNSLGGTTSYIQDLENEYETSNIGTSRGLFTIDYGSEQTDFNATISAIKMDGIHVIATGSSSFTLTDEGIYRIRMCGGGGGGGGKYKGSAGIGVKKNDPEAGGSGAVFDAEVILSPGSYTMVQGTNGTGGAGNDSHGRPGTDGTASTLSKDGVTIISCGGGKGGKGGKSTDNPGSGYGAGGVLNYSVNVVKSYKISNGVANSTVGYFSGSYGAGGGTKNGWGNDGGSGYANNGLSQQKIKFSSSSDGIDWDEIQTTIIGESANDISLLVPSMRYLKAEIDYDASISITGKIQLRSVSNFISTSSGDVKLIPFVFNNEQAYVLSITAGKISVYCQGVLVQDISALVIQEEYIKDLKYTTKDDTIILTHKDMIPQQIQRTNSGFVLSAFPYTNTPMYAFGGETTATKTVSITPSEVEGAIKITAASSIFDSSYVGQYIDGNGGRVRITEYISGTVLNGVTVIPFYTKDAIASWTYISGYEAVWSATRGYPRTCLFAQQRLWFGGSRDLPAHLWASRVNDYNNFKNAGNYDNDAIDVTLLTNNPILNLVEQRGLHIFTSGEEWTVSENSYTPNDISVKCNTKNGSISVEPVVIDGTIMYVEKNGKSILGYVYSYEQAAYTSTNLSMLNNLVKNPRDMAAEINSNTDRGNFLFVVMEDGTMAVGCISLPEQIFSLSKYVTDGKVKDICCLPSETYLIVNRNGINILEQVTEDKTDMTQAGFVDGDVIPNMQLYAGKNVVVYDDEDVEFCYVLEDKINLSKEYHKEMNVGIAFDYKIVGNPIAINNKTMTCKKRISKATVYCKDTDRLEFNGQKKKGRDVFEFYACTSYKDDVRFVINGEFYPVNILSVTLNLNYEG